MPKHKIETIGGHALLHCRAGSERMPAKEADMRDIEPADNMVWHRYTFDLSLYPPVSWGEWVHDAGRAQISFEDGGYVVLEMSYQAFDQL